MSETRKTPGQAACEAFWTAVGAGPDGQPADAGWRWAQAQNATEAWEAAAKAATDATLAPLAEKRLATAGTQHLARELLDERYPQGPRWQRVADIP